MTQFLKTTQIAIDGARTLPRRYYVAPEVLQRSSSRSLSDAGSASGGRTGSPSRAIISCSRSGNGKHHRAARQSRRSPGVLQRLSPPGDPALRGAHRAVLRNDPVSLPRLDLFARRAADRGAFVRGHRGLRKADYPLHPGGDRSLGRLPLHQSGGGARAVREGVSSR